VREALALVDTQQDALTLLGAGSKVRFEASEYRCLTHALIRKAKAGSYHAQKIICLHLRRYYVGTNDIFFRKELEERTDQQGFSGPYVTRNDDETLALLYAISHIRECSLVPPAAEKEARIGAQAKGLCIQIVEVLVHVKSAW
jgi:hypothetical protein